MFVAFSFVGTMPSYIVESIHQVQTFFDGDVYLIASDIHSPFLKLLKNVHIIDSKTVESSEFNNLLAKTRNRFMILDKLKGREELFIRSFERFFLLSRLMKDKDLTDGLFLELDIMIYDDPRTWLEEFQKYNLCYMFDNYHRCSSGIMYVKTGDSLSGFLSYCTHFIQNTHGFVDEMTALYRYYELEKGKGTVQLLPTHWNYPPIASEHFSKYGKTIFDALAIGVMVLGLDPFHTNGEIVRGKKSKWSLIDYTPYSFRWEEDSKKRRIPQMWNGEQWIRINNLHVHSKLLHEALSVPLNL